MARYSGKSKPSDKTKEEAQQIARGTQRPGQTKEQTRLIAKGIQKGIEQYKKQQSAKRRELDRRLKKVSVGQGVVDTASESQSAQDEHSCSKLPWVLLILSWLGYAVVAFVHYAGN
jgi:hypothetical protein